MIRGVLFPLLVLVLALHAYQLAMMEWVIE